MSERSTIEWTDATWNPVTGCDSISPGCARCYAERFAERFRGVAGHPYEHGFDLQLRPERLEQPLHWRRPRRVFVCSMSDLFHHRISFAFIDRVFDVMADCHEHTFQVLTKRPVRMLEWVRHTGRSGWDQDWPWPNIWLGVSIENRRFIHRADLLRQVPAAVRFVSAEPLLGPLIRAVAGVETWGSTLRNDRGTQTLREPRGLDLTGIDWLIVGGESGPNARPMQLDWVRDLIAVARDAGAAPFVKQLGTAWAQGRGAGGKGADPSAWPEDLRIREFPRPAPGQADL